MAKQIINLGTAPSGAGGDDRRSAWLKAIANFDELYSFIATGFNRANILGAVGQASGVPTGAIIQRGSNANGEYVRYADGTQICWTTTPGLVPPAGLGSCLWTFPIAFAARPGFAALTPDTQEIAQRRMAADTAIAPLQDAVDLEEATAEEVDRLKNWKRYRIALSRVPEQSGYPAAIDWPATPN